MDAYCFDCIHIGNAHVKGGIIKVCCYSLNTGNLRGCPPGEGCTKKVVGEPLSRSVGIAIEPKKNRYPTAIG